ncbi:hypothetical protein [Ruegeria lacuscaerulensis]|uniref:hypothetical protein n=1 Tax=Ruegeria lacuscaerulensis TaxID=55218 RepID=UPI0014808749|nr:hypothetical protein [Ruegeria lacuscaerulensis]
MQRVDTHLHLWNTEQFDNPWRQNGSFSGLPDAYRLEDAVAEPQKADTYFVVVQAEVNHAEDPVEKTTRH